MRRSSGSTINPAVGRGRDQNRSPRGRPSPFQWLDSFVEIGVDLFGAAVPSCSHLTPDLLNSASVLQAASGLFRSFLDGSRQLPLHIHTEALVFLLGMRQTTCYCRSASLKTADIESRRRALMEAVLVSRLDDETQLESEPQSGLKFLIHERPVRVN